MAKGIGRSERSGRVARRRERVRARILDVAAQLIRRRGIDGVTVDAVTERADISRASFYSHFPSKHDLLVPMTQARVEALRGRISRLTENVRDPRRVVAMSLRYTLRGLAADPLCAWLLLHSGLPPDRLADAFRASAVHDVTRGVELGRFSLLRLEVTESLVVGGLVGVLGDRLKGTLTDEDLDLTVEYVLRMLGVPATEARALAHGALPPLEPAG